jgi:thymidylate synthase
MKINKKENEMENKKFTKEELERAIDHFHAQLKKERIEKIKQEIIDSIDKVLQGIKIDGHDRSIICGAIVGALAVGDIKHVTVNF